MYTVFRIQNCLTLINDIANKTSVYIPLLQNATKTDQFVMDYHIRLKEAKTRSFFKFKNRVI